MSSIDDYLHNEWQNKWFKTMKLKGTIDCQNLSKSEHLTTNLILNNLHGKWNLSKITDQLTMDDVLFILKKCPKISVRKGKEHNVVNTIDWRKLSESKNITIENILSNPSLPWDSYGMLRNPNLKPFHIIENPDFYWHFNDYAMYGILNSVEIFKQNPNLPCNWNIFSSCASMNNIIENPDLPWKWNYISCNPNLTTDVICNNLDKKWIWIVLFKRNGFFNEECHCKFPDDESDEDFVYKYMTEFGLEFAEDSDEDELIQISKKAIDDSNSPIKFTDIFKLKYREMLKFPNCMSMCKLLTIEILLENLNVKWDWYYVSASNIVTLDVIQQHPNLPWDWAVLSAKKYDNDDYLNSQKLSISLATILWFYDGLKVCENVVDGDKILSDSYLVKMICKFIS